jgi:anti-anti-sigma regulatory factor
MLSVIDTKGCKTLVFEGQMCIENANLYNQAIDDNMIVEPGMRLDLTAVTKIDTTGIQLLFKLLNIAQQSGCPFEHITHSQASKRVYQNLTNC